MAETVRIRFTIDLPWAKAGTEFDVFSDQGKYIRVHGKRGTYCFYLSELEGWYEVVRWKPGTGIGYNYVDIKGFSAYAVWADSPEDNARYSLGNCDQDNIGGRERVKALAEKVRVVFEEGV